MNIKRMFKTVKNAIFGVRQKAIKVALDFYVENTIKSGSIVIKTIGSESDILAKTVAHHKGEIITIVNAIQTIATTSQHLINELKEDEEVKASLNRITTKLNSEKVGLNQDIVEFVTNFTEANKTTPQEELKVVND